MDAHVKNIEAATTDGKYDPAVGLLQVISLIYFIVQAFQKVTIIFFLEWYRGYLS